MQNSTGVPACADRPTTPALSAADRAAHEAASYVRRVVTPTPTPMPPLPTEPAARRRAIQQREW